MISGKPIATALTYGAPERGGRQQGTEGDETEDLYELLREVMVGLLFSVPRLMHSYFQSQSAHPEVNAVCSGAILSNYQRTRIEHVTQRLSLTSFSFLWQRPEAMLVDEMIAAGMVPVIIKVAGLGLKVSDVGKTLAALRPKLGQLVSRTNLRIEDLVSCVLSHITGAYVWMSCRRRRWRIRNDNYRLSTIL